MALIINAGVAAAGGGNSGDRDEAGAAAVSRAVRAARRGTRGGPPRRRRPRRRRRTPHRRARAGAGRGDPRQSRRARRRRGLSARLFALDQGGARAHGARRGAVARAGRRDRRPPDRGQARRRPLARRRHQIDGAPGFGFGVDARHRRPRHPSGRDAGDDPRRRSSSASACRPCARRRGRRCGSSARISCSARPSTEALARARGHAEFRYSFDMLGEGARTAADADKYFDAYAGAIEAIGASAGNAALPARPGISVKLSALHPRFEAISRDAGAGASCVPRAHRARAAGQGARPAIHRRCRGGGSAGTVARRHRRRARRSVAARLGRLRPCRAGLSEARAGGDRAGSRRRPPRSAAADGAAGQGRLLGHRDQARAGARACRLSGIHPQGDDRPLLHGLREKTAGGARGGFIRNSPPTMRSPSPA